MEKEFVKEYQISVTKNDTLMESRVVTRSEDLYSYAISLYDSTVHVLESSYALFLNSWNKIIGFAKLSTGGIDKVLVDKRIILKYAINTMSTGVVLIHNHPSENMTPSREDNDLTADVRKALDILGIRLIDHLIVSEKGYFSYHDRALI